MTTRGEVGEILRNEARPDRRQLYFGALLQRELGEDASAVIIVGGSAIEIYSRGGYASGDLDLVGERARIAPILDSWGFKRGGRLWQQSEWKLSVGLVGTEYTGDASKARTIVTPWGPVRLAALEDLIIKRLASCKHWKIPGDFQHALLLARAFRDELDWEYIRSSAREYKVADLQTTLEELVRSSSDS
jgi:hypothetical protein